MCPEKVAIDRDLSGVQRRMRGPKSPLATVLVGFSVVVKKKLTKSNMGRKGFVWFTDCTEGSQGRTLSQKL